MDFNLASLAAIAVWPRRITAIGFSPAGIVNRTAVCPFVDIAAISRIAIISTGAIGLEETGIMHMAVMIGGLILAFSQDGSGLSSSKGWGGQIIGRLDSRLCAIKTG